MTLLEAQDGKEYIISKIVTDDEELDAFLFSLGCYSGEAISKERPLIFCFKPMARSSLV